MATEPKTRKRRDPSEILAELQAKMNAVQAKIADSQYRDSAPISKVLDLRDDITNDMRTANVAATSTVPSLNLNKRRHTLQLKVARLDAEEKFNEVATRYGAIAEPFYTKLMGEAIGMLQAGKKEKDVQKFVDDSLEQFQTDNAEVFEEYQSALADMEDAEKAVSDWLEERKSTVRAPRGRRRLSGASTSAA